MITVTNSNQLELTTNKLYYLTTKSAAKTPKNTVGSPENFFHMTLLLTIISWNIETCRIKTTVWGRRGRNSLAGKYRSRLT